MLQELSSDLTGLAVRGRIIFIEFSRPDNLRALKNFSQQILSNALAIYLDVSFETCWQRNVDRIKRLKDQGIDAHYVPKERMEKSYGKDDKDQLMAESPIPVVSIPTEERDAFNELDKGIEKALEKIKEIRSLP